MSRHSLKMTSQGSTSELAALLSITTRQVNKLTGQGVFRRVREGVYDLPKSNTSARFMLGTKSAPAIDGRGKLSRAE
jgi:hypothetical protein